MLSERHSSLLSKARAQPGFVFSLSKAAGLCGAGLARAGLARAGVRADTKESGSLESNDLRL